MLVIANAESTSSCGTKSDGEQALCPATSVATPTTPVAQSTSSGASAATPTTQVHWADIGDSYSSGVAWSNIDGSDNTFDNNEKNCLRINEAYTVQMMRDTGWAHSYTNFTACSGSELVNMVQGDANQGQQMSKVGKPNFVTMTAGGNNLGFGRLVGDCLFQINPKVQYADDKNRTGLCAKSIDDTNKTINDPGNFRKKLNDTLEDILHKSPAVDDALKIYDEFYVFWAG